MVLVDSSVWIEASRRTGDLGVKVALEAILEEFAAVVCSPVRLEVLGGARRQDRASLASYLGCLPYVGVEERDYNQALRNAWSLQDRGLQVPWNDLLIATISQRLGCRVFARDRHFEAMAGILGLRLYQPGYGGQYNPGIDG